MNNFKAYRVRLLELRRKINAMFEAELARLDDEELEEAKEKNGRRIDGIVDPITGRPPDLMTKS